MHWSVEAHTAKISITGKFKRNVRFDLIAEEKEVGSGRRSEKTA